MDAGLAALLGALIGALTTPVSAYLSRRFDRVDRAEQRTLELRERQRTAIQAVDDAFGALLQHVALSQERVAAAQALTGAMTRLDLLLGPGDTDLITSLRSIGPRLTANADAGTPEGATAVAAAARWTQGAASWLREETSAHAVMIAVAGG